MSEKSNFCLEKIHDACGKDVDMTRQVPGFAEIGNALFCQREGCTKVCNMQEVSSDKLYGDCKVYVDEQKAKIEAAETLASKFVNATGAIALRTASALLPAKRQQYDPADDYANHSEPSLIAPYSSRIAQTAQEAARRLQAIQSNYELHTAEIVAPIERLGDDLIGGLGRSAVDNVLFRR